MTNLPGRHRSLRAKLIFNSTAGQPNLSPGQLAEILMEMQLHAILPEVYLVQPDSPIIEVEEVARRAIQSGFSLIVVAGGDGTIGSVVGALADQNAALGIIPTGTRNNIAFSLGIPTDIPSAVALLRQGRRKKVDAGYLISGRARHWFLEVAALGLVTEIFPAADDIQHGDLTQIGAFLSTFASSTPSRLKLRLDNRPLLEMTAYMVVIANMNIIGPHYEISPLVSPSDGKLDVFVFSDMSKFDLVSFALRAGNEADEERIKHFRVRELSIQSKPAMPVMADGVVLSPGKVSASIRPRILTVVSGQPAEPALNKGIGLQAENR